jgi:predicted nucleic acid-binding protein
MIQLAQRVEDSAKLVSTLAVIEVRSAIRRRQYAGDMSRPLAEMAIQALEIEARRMIQYPVTSPILELATALVDRQNLRALDSIQLATALIARDTQISGATTQFVSSDAKLLEAAISEGFAVWNPIP